MACHVHKSDPEYTSIAFPDMARHVPTFATRHNTRLINTM